jgi:MFS family permease
VRASPDHLSAPEARRRGLVAVILSALGVGIAFGLGYPLTALVLEQRGEPPSVIGLAGAAPSLAILVLLPLLPRAVARVRPADAILVGCVLSAVAYLALYVLDSTLAWIIIRFLMGGAIALPWIVGETWINHVATDATRTRIIAFYATAFFAGFAIGPMLLDATGTKGLLPFAIGGLGSLLAAIPIVLARNLAPDLAHEPATGLAGGMRLAPAAMAGAFLGGFLETSHFALLPSVSIAAGMDEGTALRLLTVLLVGGLATQYVLGWLADKTSRTSVLIGLGIAYVGLVAFLPEALKSPPLAMLALFLVGAVVIGFYTLGLALLGEEVDARHLATANAAFILMYTLGGIIGPAISGLAMTPAPVTGFVLATAGAAALMTGVTVLAGRIKGVREDA